MNNLIQSYQTVNLTKKLFDHKNGEELIKVVQEFYHGNVENLYYLSDRGDTGESPEVIDLYVCKNGMAVMIGRILKRHILSRLPQEYIESNNLSLDREKTYLFQLNFNTFNILSVPQLKSEYTEFLKEVRKNISMKCFIKVSEEKMDEIRKKLQEKLVAENSFLSAEFKSFSNNIIVMPKKEGGYIADRIISILLNSDKTLYSYQVSTPEIDFFNQCEEIEKLVNSIFERVPDNNLIEKTENERREKRKKR